MTNDSPVYVTFLWHMHQPVYKKPQDESYLLPWVRLHAIKDYFDMAALIEETQGMRAVINIVPSLFVQLEDYIKGSAKDPFLIFSIKPVHELTVDEKLFLLKNFFEVNKVRIIDTSQRYSELWKKQVWAGGQPEKLLNYFTPQDYLDLQVLFNLAWCGPTLKRDPQILALAKKDRNFMQKEKEFLLAKQYGLISQIIPTYKRLQDKGLIEISVSPFYHPLLPLVCDNHTAKEAQPEVKLPGYRFKFPEDAEEQIRLALEYYRKLFGTEPQGMWPPEGGVNTAVLDMAAKQGLKWIATDEFVLGKSLALLEDFDQELARNLPAEKKCLPYNYKKQPNEISIFFRNQTLSNLISFVYSSWDEEKAADDFFHRLIALSNNLRTEKGQYIIPVIMDGENAWEYYPKGGEIFLFSLYQKIVNSPQFKPVTFSEFLSFSQETRQNSLTRITPGSWIEGNFSKWIGEPAKNEAWDFLFEARNALREFLGRLSPTEREKKREIIEKALRIIYIAEGSDWFWWIKRGVQPESEKKFSLILKMYLAEFYRTLGLDIPSHLKDSDSIQL